MPESINDILLRVMPSMLDGMRVQLQQAKDAGHEPVEWSIRLEQLPVLIEDARAEGVLTEDPAAILGVKVRGSWKLLPKGEGPLLVCEGDEMHRAILARYEAA